jgi:hypothetical protein
MAFPHVSFVLEVIGACLLLVMIIYAIQLNRRLAGLQADKAYLQKVIAGFNQATERAESSINRLRAAALEANDALQSNTKLAKELRGDLSFLIDRAENMADRLESSIGNGRAESAAAATGIGAQVSALRPLKGGKDTGPAAPVSHTKAALSRALAGIR